MLRCRLSASALLLALGLFFPTTVLASPGCDAVRAGALSGTATFAGTGNPTDTGTVESINTTAFDSDRSTTLSFNAGDVVNVDLTISANMYGYMRYNNPGPNFNPGFQNTASGSYSQTVPAGMTKIYIFSGRTNTANNGTVVASASCTPILPSVTSLGTSSGPATGSTSVVITGVSFSNATTVLFGATSAAFTINSDTQITATSPAGSGTVDVTVTNSTGTSATSANDRFIYVPSTPPTITSITPNTGSTAGGTSVTVTGTSFASGTTLTIGGVAATSVSITNSTTLTANTPAYVSGSLTKDVVVDNGAGSATLTNGFTYTAVAPTLTSINPTSGTTAGSTSFTLSGSGFVPGTTVTIGGVAATSISITNSTTLTGNTPAYASGSLAKDVVVNNGAGTATLSNGFTYTASAPTVSSITPSTGSTAGGTSVTISGTQFVPGTTVTIGGVAATSVSVTNSTTLTATTPAYVSGSLTKDVVVNNGVSSATLSNGFTYSASAPTVSSITPNSGTAAGGTSVTVNGTNFAPGTTVTIGGVSATGISVSNSTTLAAITPAYVSGSLVADVVVNNGTGSATLTGGFTYTVGAPTLVSINPNTGSTAGGSSVTLSGTNFTPGTTVTIGGVSATGITATNSTTLTATTPTYVSGSFSKDVVVNNGSGTATLTNGYTYSATAPAVTGVSPNSGSPAGGTSVTVTGTNLSSATSVKFGTAIASITSNTATQIVAVSPAGSGTVDITVTTVGGTSSTTAADRFSYAIPSPTITSIAPSTGPTGGGTSVTITGANLSGATTVKFGPTAATVSSNTATQIVAVSPAASAGAVDITVTTSSGTSATSAADKYTYAIPADSQKARMVQTVITKMVATTSGQLISSAVDTAIMDAFADGGSNPININPNGARINFAAEPQDNSRVDDAFQALAMASRPKSKPLQQQRDWSLWLDVRGTGWKVRDVAPSSTPGGNDLTGSQLNVTGGLGYKLNTDTLVGVLLGHEMFKYDIASLGGGLKGHGETVGGYFSRRFDHIRFDATIAWSAMSYDVVAGSANGSLTGSRWLFSTGFTGNQKIGDYLLEPSLKVFALWERQKEWTDSLGTLQDARNFSAGRASGGSKIGRVFDFMDGKLSPFVGLYGDYYFQSDNSVPAGTPVVGIQSGWSARVTSGITYLTPNGSALGLTTELGGLGANYLIWSGQIRASLRF